MKHHPLFGFFLSLTTALMWGVLPLFMLLALAHMDAITVSFFRLAFAFVFVLLLVLLNKEFPTPKQFANKRLILVLLAGVALTANYVSYVLSLARLDAESAQVIIQLAPFLLMLGGVWLFKEEFTRLQIIGALTLLLGFGLFFNGKWSLLFSSFGSYTTGVLIMVFAAVTWVAYALLQKFLLQHFSARQMTLMLYGMGAILLLPLSTPHLVVGMTLLSSLALLFCCLNTLIAYGAFTRAMSVWQASKVSAVIALAPIFTILSTTIAVNLFPALFQSSNLTHISYLGAFLVVIGSMLTALGKGRKQ